MKDHGEVKQEVLSTISNLCKWINEKCDKGASSEELKILPEVVNGVGQLYNSLR